MTETNSPTIEILAFSPHPDDAEIGCRGSLLLASRRGQRVGIVDLSDGERATRGCVEKRSLEREDASKRLGLSVRLGLGLPDTQISIDDASVRKIVEVLRDLRPQIILVPYPEDRHPDHVTAAALVRRATFLAGVGNIFDKPAHHVGALIYYMIHQPFSPSFVVDVSSVWSEAYSVLAAYESQFGLNDTETTESITALAHPGFMRTLEARAVYYGAMIGVGYGEPFWQPGPLSMRSLSDLNILNMNSGYCIYR